MPLVLFICTHNSARSQMAEGLLRARFGGLYEAASAGTEPAGVNPLAIEAMREVGIDISHHTSKTVEEALAGRTFDYVVTVCDSAKETCPFVPASKANMHGSFEDPSSATGSYEERLHVFRRVRDEIAAWLDATFAGIPHGERRTENREPVRIGITTSFNEGEQRLHRSYVEAVERAGGLPIIVPMLEDPENVRSFVRLLHGLVITGGPAITDGLIGDLPEDINDTDPVRVRSDRAVLQAFLDEKKPILGICYGMQLLNASDGGTIYGDLEEHLSDALAHSDKRGGDVHPVVVDEKSHLFAVLKHADVAVNSRHIQAVARVGPHFHVAATAPDGVVEAIENDDGTVIGVQFHPEKMGDEMLPLFRHLVENARKIMASGPNGT